MADCLVDLLPLLGLEGPSWDAWRVVAKCLDGLPLTAAEHAVYETCTGRSHPLPERPGELVVIAGRRSGKSRFAAAVAQRAAGFTSYPQLAPGERAVVGLAACDREQARVLLNYVVHPFEAGGALKDLLRPRSPLAKLADLVSRRTRWGIDLRTGVTIEVRTAHFGSIRGRSYAAAVCDEVGFWQREDGTNPASEVLAAIRPGLTTLRGQLIVISSPFAQRGPLFELCDRFFGKDDPRVVVWKAGTRVMNPLIAERTVLDALERDEASARAEWLAEFRTDRESYLTREALARVVVAGRTELPPQADVDYARFSDAASGSGQDAMTLAIAHGEECPDGTVIAVLDKVLEVKPPFSPVAVARVFAAEAQRYGCGEVTGDLFAKGFLGSAFESANVTYRPSPWTRSELYVRFLVGVNSGEVELLDHERLCQQFTALERKVGASGRDSIDHPGSGHDDLANAAAGALALIREAASQPAVKLW